MIELLEAFPQLTPAKADELAMMFREWIDAGGDRFIDYEREFAAESVSRPATC